MTTVSVFAPAKINLTLHVTGRRDDGYHLLDSLVAFAPVGDRLVFQDGNTLSLTVDGPEAQGVPADIDNLVMKAVLPFCDGRGAAMTLTKVLPVASGIGGGSSDAAAAVRGAIAFWNDDPALDLMALGPEILLETRARPLVALGADIPMCLMARPCRARGIGEQVAFVDLPAVPAVLANPRVPVSTPEVFRALAQRENAAMPDDLPALADASALIDWIAACRNDLEAPALGVAPQIGAVLEELAALEGAGLARMSGSGATCFALFPDAEAAKAATERLTRDRPDWWIAGGLLGDQSTRAMPRQS